MKIEILLFGPQAKLAQRDRVTIELGADTTVSQALLTLRDTVPELAESLNVSRLAVNHEYACADDRLAEDDEVALIGMVSGG